jgi:monofunctional biosynthetic peptidoglycan transglycosylase
MAARDGGRRRRPMATRRRGSRFAPLRRVAGRGIAWALATLVAAVLVLQFWYLAHVLWWTQVDPGPTAFMKAELARLREADPDATIDQRWVPYDRIADSLKRAVIASEDARFTEHDGVDWEAIESAFQKNQKRGRIAFGASTITMQLAKNLFLSGERSYVRKAQELVITWMLEAFMSKRRILEIYLNVAEWGEGVFGAEAAAHHHFRVPASRLGAAQSARLAAMLPRPRYYDRNPGSAWLARRSATLRRWMNDVTPP